MNEWEIEQCFSFAIAGALGITQAETEPECLGRCEICNAAILVGGASLHPYGWECKCMCAFAWERTRQEAIDEHAAKMRLNAIRLAEMEESNE